MHVSYVLWSAEKDPESTGLFGKVPEREREGVVHFESDIVPREGETAIVSGRWYRVHEVIHDVSGQTATVVAFRTPERES